jgi:hypothetical protein
MRSWSKCVIFSRRMKSSSSAGPRTPYFSEFWLSATGTPWLVVSTLAAGVDAHAVERFDGGVHARAGATLPVFSEPFSSDSVLAVGSRECGAAVGVACR